MQGLLRRIALTQQPGGQLHWRCEFHPGDLAGHDSPDGLVPFPAVDARAGAGPASGRSGTIRCAIRCARAPG